MATDETVKMLAELVVGIDQGKYRDLVKQYQMVVSVETMITQLSEFKMELLNDIKEKLRWSGKL